MNEICSLCSPTPSAYGFGIFRPQLSICRPSQYESHRLGKCKAGCGIGLLRLNSHQAFKKLSACYGGKNTLWVTGENGSLLKYSDPNLRVIKPSYWAVESSGKDILSWGRVRQFSQRSFPSENILTNQLYQNYPNPFNPETFLPYQLAQNSDVTIRIYDSHGRLVRILNHGYRPAGVYRSAEQAAHWDGCNQGGEWVASGMYFYTLQVGNFRATRRMALVK